MQYHGFVAILESSSLPCDPSPDSTQTGEVQQPGPGLTLAHANRQRVSSRPLLPPSGLSRCGPGVGNPPGSPTFPPTTTTAQRSHAILSSNPSTNKKGAPPTSLHERYSSLSWRAECRYTSLLHGHVAASTLCPLLSALCCVRAAVTAATFDFDGHFYFPASGVE